MSECEKSEIECKVSLEVSAGQNSNDVGSVNSDREIDFLVGSKTDSEELIIGCESESDDNFEPNKVNVGYDNDVDENDYDVLVNFERMDVVEEVEGIRVANEEEGKILARVREIYHSTEQREIPSLKSIDKHLVSKEVLVVNSLLKNVIAIGIPDVSKINRL